MADKKVMKKKLIPLGLLLIASAIIGATGATVIKNLSLANPIKPPTVEGKIEEKTGNQNQKEAWFENTGEADVFLRVSYAETWTVGSGDTAVLLPNQAENKSGGSIAAAAPAWNTEDWVKGQDGWWYYKNVLAGSKSKQQPDDNKKTSKLITGVTFHTEDLKDSRYQTADYRLHFTMEVVQASDEAKVSQEAVKLLFGKEITLPNSWPEGKYTTVLKWPAEETAEID